MLSFGPLFLLTYVHTTTVVGTYAQKLKIPILMCLEVCTHAQNVGQVGPCFEAPRCDSPRCFIAIDWMIYFYANIR